MSYLAQMMEIRHQLRATLLFISIFLVTVRATHFYGGTVTWKPINNTASGSTIDIMFTQSYQWRRSFNSSKSTASGMCNQIIIVNRSPMIPGVAHQLECATNSCSNYKNISVNEYCTDFSVLVDASSGQVSTVQPIIAGSKFCVAFVDGSWMRVLSRNPNCTASAGKRRRSIFRRATNQSNQCFSTSAQWSIGTCLDLTLRPGGFINTPPVATVISPINVQINKTILIEIPIIDNDGDFLRCRWAEKTGTFDECGDVCQTAPGATLNGNDCSLVFNSTGTKVGEYYAVTLMVEDFLDASSTTAFSSVPIQFLIRIVNATSCPVKPTISSNLPKCSLVEVGIQFNFTLIIQQGCPSTTLKDVFTMPPLNMYKGTITAGSNNTWTVSEKWTADVSQLGSQVFCAVATDSANIQSEQYCLTFTVIPAGSNLRCPTSTTVTSTSTTSTFTTTTTTTFNSTNATAPLISITATTFNILLTNTTIPNITMFSSSISSNASATTARTITSTGARESPSLTGLIIALSVIGFLSLLAACCFCCWWLFVRSAATNHKRRRQRNRKEKHGKEYDSIIERHSSSDIPSSLSHQNRNDEIDKSKNGSQEPHDEMHSARTSKVSHENSNSILEKRNRNKKDSVRVQRVSRVQPIDIAQNGDTSTNKPHKHAIEIPPNINPVRVDKVKRPSLSVSLLKRRSTVDVHPFDAT